MVGCQEVEATKLSLNQHVILKTDMAPARCQRAVTITCLQWLLKLLYVIFFVSRSRDVALSRLSRPSATCIGNLFSLHLLIAHWKDGGWSVHSLTTVDLGETVLNGSVPSVERNRENTEQHGYCCGFYLPMDVINAPYETLSRLVRATAI